MKTIDDVLSSIRKTGAHIKFLGNALNKEDLESTLLVITRLAACSHSCIELLSERFPDEMKAFFRKTINIPIVYSTLPAEQRYRKKLIEQLEVGKDYPFDAKGKRAHDSFGLISGIYELFEVIRSDEAKDLGHCIYLYGLGGIEKPVGEAILRLPPLKKDSTTQWANVMTDALMLCKEMHDSPEFLKSLLANDAQLIFEKSDSIRKNQMEKAESRHKEKHREVLADPDSDLSGTKLTKEQWDKETLLAEDKAGGFKRKGAYYYILNCLENWVK